MSDTVSFGSDTPPPPPPPGFDAGAPSPPPPPRRAGHKGVVAIVTIVMCVLLAGGTYAFIEADPLHLFHNGPQAAEAVPDTALAYLGVDVDPSAQQKVDALTFLEHFPSFSKSTGIDDTSTDLRKLLVDEALKKSGCGLSYADDFAPWLGTKLGVAVMPADHEGGEPVPLVVLQVSDAEAARQTLTKVAACGSDGKIGIASTGDYVLVARDQNQADTYAKAADAGPLSEDDHFKADMASLGDLGVITGWVDLAGLSETLASQSAAGPLGGGMMMGSGLGAIGSHTQRVAATLRFTGDSAEAVASAISDKAPTAHPDNAIAGLPDSTVFAASLAGGGDAFRAQWSDLEKALSGAGLNVDRQLQQLERRTGLSVPTDIETLLGDNLLVAVDGSGLSGDTLGRGLLGIGSSKLDVGVRFDGDQAALDDLYQRVIRLVRQESGVGSLPLTKVDFDSGFAIATNESYGQTLADLGGDLGTSPDFRSVIPDAAKANFVAYLDWNAIEKAVLDSGIPGLDSAVIDNLKPIRAVGMSVSSSGGYTHETLKVSVDD